MRPKLKTKTVTFELPLDTLENLIVSHLYATSWLNDNQEVTSFEILQGIDKFNKIQFKMKITNDQKT